MHANDPAPLPAGLVTIPSFRKATRVRQAGADDAALLADVAAATFALACPPGTTAAAIADFIATHLTVEHFAEYLADPARDLFLGLDEQHLDEHQAVGYTMLVSADPSDPDVAAVVTRRPAAELSKVYVRASQHGTGLAAELVEATVARARERGAGVVWLGVNQLNAKANRFYEKQGFVLVGTKRFLVGDKLEDDFVRAVEL